MSFKVNRPKDLSGHDQTGCSWIDLDISGYESNIVETFLEVAKLLVGQRLDGGRVDCSEITRLFKKQYWLRSVLRFK